MKIHAQYISRTSKGFTLIELLVTIAIITILMSLATIGVFKALRTAQRNKAVIESRSIASAVELFYKEYGWLPVPAASQGTTALESAQDGSNPENIIQVLMASAPTSVLNQVNPQKKVFLDVDYAAEDGIILDPWGNPYLLKMDLDFDGKVEFTNTSDVYNTRVIVWSTGVDILDDEDDVANVVLDFE